MLDVGNTDEYIEENNQLYSRHHFGVFSKLFTYVYYVKYMVIRLHNIICIYSTCKLYIVKIKNFVLLVICAHGEQEVYVGGGTE